MNHKKLMPANGISVAAVAIPLPRLFSHSDEAAAPSGMLVRIRISTAPNSSAKITPATAAARGVVSWRGLGLDDIAITSSSHRTAHQPGYFTTNFDSHGPVHASTS